MVKSGRRVYFTFGLHLRAVGTRHIKDGLHGGSGGAIYSKWMTGSDYQDKFSMSIHFQYWLQVKIVYKVCNNYTVNKKVVGRV